MSEKKAVELLRIASQRPGRVVRLEDYYRSLSQIRKRLITCITDYPHLMNTKDRIVWKRDAFKFFVRRVIHMNRRRVNLWANVVKKAIVHVLTARFQEEYTSGLRLQSTCTALCKAEAAIYQEFPTIASFTTEARP